MRYLFGFMCVLALGVMGCGDSEGTGGSGGDRGPGGSAGMGGEATFSYSVITSSTGNGADLLDELRASTLPTLEVAGAVVYALWGRAAEQREDFSEIAEDQVVVMLSWARIDTDLLADELESVAGASSVETSLYEASLRGDEPLSTGPGFYIHRFNRYGTEDVNEVLSLSEQAWVTWEPTFDAKAVGVWRDLQEEDGLTRLLRIAWYEDLEHWEETRDFERDLDSFVLFAQRAALQEDDEAWSAGLLER